MFRKVGDGWSKFWWGKGVHAHRDNVVEDIYLRLYTGTVISEYSDYKLPRSLELLNNVKFINANPSVIYIHGYEETAEQESVKVVVEAYLQAQPDTNVILVDWSNMAFGNYLLNAAPNTKKVALAVSEEIKKLIGQGLNIDNIHLIGHSLGGQIIAFIGRELQKSDILIKRVTSLDPAFPGFYPGLIAPHITATDAEFVDIIHTDAGFYGAPVSTGTVDFWPNGGVGKQPGCPKFAPIPLSEDSLCSHWRSWRFWAESVLNPTAFPSVSASSYGAFLRENREPNPDRILVYMGPNTDTNAKGNYYMKTNSRTPFGKGVEGTYSAK